MKNLPKYVAVTVGLVGVLTALLGLLYNAVTASAAFQGRFSDLVLQDGVPHFYLAFFCMSAICVGCYSLLLVCCIGFIRLKTRAIGWFTGLVVFEVLYFVGVSGLWLSRTMGPSIAAATGVANGGLMAQFLILFPLWAPIALYWSRGQLEHQRAEADRSEAAGLATVPSVAATSQRSPRRRFAFKAAAICGAVLLVAGITLSRFRVVQVAYHKWQMQRAWNSTFAGPGTTIAGGLVGYTLGDSYKQYEEHRDALIRLGAARELHYQFKHILTPTPASQRLCKMLVGGERPACIDFESPAPSNPTPMELTVWCYADDALSWDVFVAEQDKKQEKK
jgi:hypothetical protein